MSNKNKLKTIIEFLASNTTGRTNELIEGIGTWFNTHGELSAKQITAIISISRQVKDQLEASAEAEAILSKFLASGEGRTILKLAL